MTIMKLVFVLFVASLCSCVLSYSQRDALYDIKTKLQDSNDQLSSWKYNQVTPCLWNYVRCNGEKVIGLVLPSMGFNGTLSPRIGEPIYLEELSLLDNRITGDIPTELGDLSRLTSLKLQNNRLTGEIPGSLGNLSKLQFLDLSGNSLRGNVPDSFSNLQSLININLAFNNLSGDVPKQLFQVSSYNFTGNMLSCGKTFSNDCAFSTANQGSSHSSRTGLIPGSIGGKEEELSA